MDQETGGQTLEVAALLCCQHAGCFSNFIYSSSEKGKYCACHICLIKQGDLLLWSWPCVTTVGNHSLITMSHNTLLVLLALKASLASTPRRGSTLTTGRKIVQQGARAQYILIKHGSPLRNKTLLPPAGGNLNWTCVIKLTVRKCASNYTSGSHCHGHCIHLSNLIWAPENRGLCIALTLTLILT